MRQLPEIDAEARIVLASAAARLRQISDDLTIGALADAIENAANGQTEAACEALREAEALRRVKA